MKQLLRALKRILCDPIGHFLLLGTLLFGLYYITDRAQDDRNIVVSRDALLTFIQYRTKIFDPAMAEAKLTAMTGPELKQLVDDYIEEEALYREAESLGFDKQDYIIKRRMVQKVEFIISDENATAQTFGEKQLRKHYRDNIEQYRTPPRYSFAHIFIPSDGVSSTALTTSIQKMAQELVKQRPSFTDATGLGQRFPYGVNFMEAETEQIKGIFGTQFAAELSKLTAKQDVWQGPVMSAFGAHFVMLVGKSENVVRSFKMVRDEVETGLSKEIADQQAKNALAGIVARYPVVRQFEDSRLK